MTPKKYISYICSKEQAKQEQGQKFPQKDGTVKVFREFSEGENISVKENITLANGTIVLILFDKPKKRKKGLVSREELRRQAIRRN